MHFGFRKINPSDVVALCIALNELINFVNCAIRLNNFVNTSGGTIIRQVDRVDGGYSSQSENIVQRKKDEFIIMNAHAVRQRVVVHVQWR